MGKSSQVAVDQDSSSDRITARVGSRTKKAKVVFDPSDHHVPRKRNRRGENDLAATGTPKSEPNRTATPSSSSSTDGASNNNHVPTGTSATPTPPPVAAAAPKATVATVGQRATTAGSSFRSCQKCGKSGPGRLPRKAPVTPWTCSTCLLQKTESKTSTSKQQMHSEPRSTKPRSGRTAEEEEEEDAEGEGEEVEEDDGSNHDAQEEEECDEEDNKQQHDFAGFSENELTSHGNVGTVLAEERLSAPIKEELSTDSDDGQAREMREHTAATVIKSNHSDGEGDESRKEIRDWTCEDVCRFFSKYCKTWGDIFQEQEIDGSSLLLMRKTDVLSRFGLKLGPAMELYQRIVALQNGDRDVVDVRLTWI